MSNITSLGLPQKLTTIITPSIFIYTCSPQAIGIQEYLAAMRRLEKALSDLTATKLRANQKAASDFSFLLAQGSSKLQEVFRSILLENINPIEPLHYITKR